MLTLRLQRLWGLRAHRAWACLLLDRLHDLIYQSYESRQNEDEEEVFDRDSYLDPGNLKYRQWQGT